MTDSWTISLSRRVKPVLIAWSTDSEVGNVTAGFLRAAL